LFLLPLPKNFGLPLKAIIHPLPEHGFMSSSDRFKQLQREILLVLNIFFVFDDWPMN
jgi:hypothetical protein